MATSGSVDYTVTRSDIVSGAAEDAGILAVGQTLESGVESRIVSRLNLLVKQWQGTNDYAPGLKVWTRRRATVFLQANKNQYALGPTGDHATDAYVTTTLTAESLSTDTTLTVSSIAGISSGDFAGIVMDDGTLYWDVVSGAPSGSTVTITTGVPSTASSGSRCFFYTTKMRRPIDILTANLRNADNEDVPLGMMDLYQYESIGSKTADGDPCNIFYEAQLINGQMYTDYEPSNVNKVIRLVYLSDVEDLDATSDNFDYPSPWYRALRSNLGLEVCAAFDREPSQQLREIAATSLAIAKNLNPETCSDYFEPDR
jgi:hypothetical protein